MLVRNYQTTGRHVAKHNHHVSTDTNLRGDTLRSLVYCQNGMQDTYSTFQTKVKRTCRKLYFIFYVTYKFVLATDRLWTHSYSCAWDKESWYNNNWEGVRATRLILQFRTHTILPSAETEPRLRFSMHRRIGGPRVDLSPVGTIKCLTVWGIEPRSSRLWPSLCSPTVISHSMKLKFNLAYCNEQTVSSAVVLKKLTALQLLRKFPSFYGIRRFITVFTTSRHFTNFPPYAYWVYW
jgi:hypothetical protein